MIRVVIIGVAGRMGKALLRAAAHRPDITIAGAVASPASGALGEDAGVLAGLSPLGVQVSDELTRCLAQADVAVDFSSPTVTQGNVEGCRAARKPLLVGTTGYAVELTRVFEAAAQDIPLLIAPNTSVGITLLSELVRHAARALPADFDIEILESHHRLKRDAPSGTALALGRAASEGRQAAGRAGGPMESVGSTIRPPGAVRREGEIGYAVVRGGDIVGEHTVLFAGTGERLALSHQATDRAIFARGALRAAAWLAGRPAGRYSMRDILSMESVF